MEAAPTYWRMPVKVREQMYDGCGPGHLGDYCVPDYILGLCVTEACRIHDHDYEIGETNKDRKRADTRLLRNLTVLVYSAKNKNRLVIRARMRIAFLFYKMVRRYGNNSFWKNKYKD